jgi:hypothetical protein
LERKTRKEETPEEVITRNPKREKYKKKKGAANPILAAAPLNPFFFLARSPSTLPPAAARLGKFPSFLAKIIN